MGVTRGDLSDSVGILINIRRLTLRSQFCLDKKNIIGGHDATIVIAYTDEHDFAIKIKSHELIMSL